MLRGFQVGRLDRGRDLDRDEAFGGKQIVLTALVDDTEVSIALDIEPTNLPESTEVELRPLDPGDWLDDADRAALHEALAQSHRDVGAGRLIDAADILKALRLR